MPRHREVLAKTCNSLGVLEKDTGRLDDAEVHLRRQVPLARRLADDFPDRPEYRSILGRALTNLGTVLYEQGRVADAEPILREAIALELCHRRQVGRRCPGPILPGHIAPRPGRGAHEAGKCRGGDRCVQEARVINEAMVARLPDKPRYRSDLASNLDSLALAMSALAQPAVDETFRAANAIYERLITAYPDNIDYRVRQAVCLRTQGDVLSNAGRHEQAEPNYQKALAVLDATDPNAPDTRLAAKAGRDLDQPGHPATSPRPKTPCDVQSPSSRSYWPASRGPRTTATTWL